MEQLVSSLSEQYQLTEAELFSLQPPEKKDAEHLDYPPYSYRREVVRAFFEKRSSLVMLILLAAVLIFSFVYPMFSNYDRYANLMTENAKHLSPTQAMERFGTNLHWILGTGQHGESVFDAVWNGARISLSLAFLCGAINMLIGVAAGTLWGMSKRGDPFLMAIYHAVGNVPYILIVSVMLMLLGSGFRSMVLALTVTGWMGIAYQVRVQVMIIREREYNQASIGLGSSLGKRIRRNILPHLVSVIVTLLAEEIPSYISYEVFLSYIGIGLSDLSLGRLIYEAEPAMFTPAWRLEFWSPVAVACIVTVVLYVTGQRLGDASDPRRHR